MRLSMDGWEVGRRVPLWTVALLVACGETTGDVGTVLYEEDGSVPAAGGSTAASGGASSGGRAAGGRLGAGGSSAGGTSAGGTSAGGSSSGGTSSGGTTDAGAGGAPIDPCGPPLGLPLHGRWTEVAQLSCSDRQVEVEPEQVIQEVIFFSGGFQVTWIAFETYVDYHGSYTTTNVLVGPETWPIRLTPESGNYVPPDVDGEGSFRRCGDDLILMDVWLGSPQSSTRPPACGHRLRWQADFNPP